MGHPANRFGSWFGMNAKVSYWVQLLALYLQMYVVIGLILSMVQVLFLGCLWGQCPIKNWRPPWLCSKKKKWWTELPEGFAYPIPPSLGPIFAARGQVILGYLANRFGSRFEQTQNYCRKLLAYIYTEWLSKHRIQ